MKAQKIDAEKQLAGFIAKFEPRNQRLIRSVRAELRRRFPTANELVYDNYNFFVIGFCPNERPSDCLFSIAAGSNGVSICFTHGAKLPDLKGILSGAGKQTRFLHVDSVADLKRPEVGALFEAAAANARVPIAPTGPGKLIIRSVSAKQRPRRKTS